MRDEEFFNSASIRSVGMHYEKGYLLTMTGQHYHRIKVAVRRFLRKDWTAKLDALEADVRNLEQRIENKRLKVIIGPSFAIYSPSFALDRAISYALRVRGVDVLPIYCDGIQDVECNYFGGPWGGRESFKKNCINCKKTSQRLWQLNPNRPILLSSYLSVSDKDELFRTVSGLSYEEALEFERDGISYGKMAKDILVNNYLVGNPTLIENYEDLLKVHLRNILIVSRCYERVLDDIKPDRVISNDSYYGMWAILERQCKRRNIPFYSHWPATKNRIAFAFNDAAMNLDFTKSWGKFRNEVLTSEEEKKVEKWLTGERGYMIDTTKLNGHERESSLLNSIDPNKPALVLAANVIWDLAALNKQIIFRDMIDWILKTIGWFRLNQDFQLIIRPHPAEVSPQIPRTRETVSSAIELSGVDLPANVFLLKPDAKVTFSQLIARANVRGVTVHTTTVGFECPAQGVPVVTTGRAPYRGFGFTIDPKSEDEYYLSIKELLTGHKKSVSESEQQLARRFIKFYQFHYYSDTGLFSGNPFMGEPIELSERFLSLLDSDEGAFGYVIKSIIDGASINGGDRWIPAS